MEDWLGVAREISGQVARQSSGLSSWVHGYLSMLCAQRRGEEFSRN